MTSSPRPNLVQPEIPPADDEIDLRQIAAALRRQKNLVAGIAGVSVILSGVYAYTREPVWEGQFQIVLEQQDTGTGGRLAQFAADNPIFANLAGLQGGGGSELETEVKVLESSSVLKSTYDFVRANKAKAGKNISNWSFTKWRDANLEIELQTGTSVLNITYRDTDRNLILPVINKISNDYQLYSGRDRSESISSGLAFVKEQVEQFRKRAAASSRALDSFSITYGISTEGESISSSGFDMSKLLGSKTTPRELSLIGSINSSTLSSMGSINTSTMQGDALSQLAAINQELIRRQQRFTSRDPGVLALIRERDALRRYIEVTAGGSLTLPGQQPASKEQAQELILQFKELDRTARRDAATLDELESSLLSLQLEQARQTDPWELISTPTMTDHPVAPIKKRIVALGLLGGLVLGCGAALVRDRRSGLVFSEDELRTSIPGPLLERLLLQQTRNWPMACELLAQGPLKQAQTIALIPVGQPDTSGLQALTTDLQTALSGRALLVSSDLVKTRGCDTQLLVVQSGNCTRSQLARLQQSLALQGTPIAGWLLLDSTAEVT